MTSAAQATPFSFDAFDAENPDAAEPRAIPADEAAKAVEEARREALNDARLREMQHQTALLKTIISELKTNASAIDAAVEARSAELNDGAAAIVKRFCEGTALDREADLAIGLLGEFIEQAPEKTKATILLPHAAESVKRVRDYVEAAKLSHLIAVEQSEALAPGDVKIEWRGGAMRRSLESAVAQIDSLLKPSA